LEPARIGEAEISAWCIAYIARTLDMPAEEVDAASRFTRLGLDSASSVHMIVELEDWLGLELEPDLVVEHPTIEALARHLAALRNGP
jgi:acyl carrier protein